MSTVYLPVIKHDCLENPPWKLPIHGPFSSIFHGHVWLAEGSSRVPGFFGPVPGPRRGCSVASAGGAQLLLWRCAGPAAWGTSGGHGLWDLARQPCSFGGWFMIILSYCQVEDWVWAPKMGFKTQICGMVVWCNLHRQIQLSHQTWGCDGQETRMFRLGANFVEVFSSPTWFGGDFEYPSHPSIIPLDCIGLHWIYVSPRIGAWLVGKSDRWISANIF